MTLHVTPGVASAMLLALALVGCGATPAGALSAEQSAPDGAVGRVPDFELDALSGGTVSLSDYLGEKVILLDFWATYCAPCLVAMPHLDELHQRHGPAGLRVLGVSIDGPESIAQVRNVVSRLGIRFPILLDQDSRVAALYNPRASAPYSVLIGRDGRIRTRREGYAAGAAADLERDIEVALR